ncbi:enoyl-CoA hydratase-related protein [Pseudomonas sp. NA13]
MHATVVLQREGDVGQVIIDNPPVNALSLGVREQLLERLQEALADSAIKVIVIACQGRTFVAGADIKEFDLPLQAPHLPEVLAAIEQASKPVVAALHGSAFGGGLELALACHYRVAAPDAQFALPEVSLGLIPGAGARNACHGCAAWRWHWRWCWRANVSVRRRHCRSVCWID